MTIVEHLPGLVQIREGRNEYLVRHSSRSGLWTLCREWPEPKCLGGYDTRQAAIDAIASQ